MTDDQTDKGQPDSAEGDQASSASEAVPEELSGEGATPLGSSDDHSDAPGPHGLGPLNPDAPEPEESPGLAPLEPEPSEADED